MRGRYLFSFLFAVFGCLDSAWGNGAGVSPAPSFGPVTPKTVFIDFGINRIDAINYDQQTFEVDFYLEMWWLAEHSGRPFLPMDSFVSLENADLSWRPVNDFFNIKSLNVLTEPYYSQLGGYMLAESRYQGVFYSEMDLRDFPFDHQRLVIKVEDNNEGALDLIYQYGSPFDIHAQPGSVRIPSSGIFETSLEFPEFTILDSAGFTSEDHLYEFTYDQRVYAQANLIIDVERKSGYYMYKVLLVSLLLTLAGLLMFFIPEEDLVDRMSYGITVFLAMIGHSFATKDDLPRISYLTILDAVVLASNLVIFLILLVSIYRYQQNQQDYFR